MLLAWILVTVSKSVCGGMKLIEPHYDLRGSEVSAIPPRASREFLSRK